MRSEFRFNLRQFAGTGTRSINGQCNQMGGQVLFADSEDLASPE
jgi:hypothetical protein